uniref:Arsenate reductase ArsC n=1 Tax=candidate division WOR-3 bacterium TaxID=2052148 RepID=A0A7C1NI49_UNCW3
MRRILFACVGNSCRSQLAEAFCRALGRDVDCASAGSRPEREVAPETVAVMQEMGIDISGARPKGFADLPDLKFDYLVTMGCEVNCPCLPGAKRIEWQIPDPGGKGIEEYRRVRDIIRKEVEGLLKEIKEEK